MNGMMVLVLAGMAVVSSLWADESKPFLLPVEGSGGRAVRYFAGHPLDQRDEKSEHAVVIVHGLNGGKRDGAERIRSILKKTRDISSVYFVAPCIVVEKMLTDEEKTKLVYWEGGRWQGGGDSPVASGFSSYDVLDRIFAKLNDPALYPVLKTVLLCGYSAGGQVISRYVTVSGITPREGIQVNFAAGAPSSWLFLDEAQPWHYGLAERNRYAAGATRESALARLASRYCLCFCGTEDRAKEWLDMKATAMAQGANRYERFLNFRKHVESFPQLKGHLVFTEVKGGKHGGACYDNPAFIGLVFGER
ncbi:MAG: hypothetical protein J6334_10130 [Kiritimatiellae bacterium]|nr:hypothetical protein [Kiritimatiellia bacterium]